MNDFNEYNKSTINIQNEVTHSLVRLKLRHTSLIREIHKNDIILEALINQRQDVM